MRHATGIPFALHMLDFIFFPLTIFLFKCSQKNPKIVKISHYFLFMFVFPRQEPKLQPSLHWQKIYGVGIDIHSGFSSSLAPEDSNTKSLSPSTGQHCQCYSCGAAWAHGSLRILVFSDNKQNSRLLGSLFSIKVKLPFCTCL